MAIIGDRIRDVVRREINKNADKIDHQVDCICRDIRSGKSKPSDVKKVRKFIYTIDNDQNKNYIYYSYFLTSSILELFPRFFYGW